MLSCVISNQIRGFLFLWGVNLTYCTHAFEFGRMLQIYRLIQKQKVDVTVEILLLGATMLTRAITYVVHHMVITYSIDYRMARQSMLICMLKRIKL